jgi:predicted RNA binding protein YcfA (HicA-like mRNA interferase family)
MLIVVDPSDRLITAGDERAVKGLESPAMNRRELLLRLLRGHNQNVGFAELRELILAFGFREVRIRGSHHLFAHPAVEEPVSFQPRRGEAKPYQIRQFLRLVERYNLKLEEEP